MIGRLLLACIVMIVILHWSYGGKSVDEVEQQPGGCATLGLHGLVVLGAIVLFWWQVILWIGAWL